MNLAIVSIEDSRPLAEMSRASMLSYSKKVGADMVLLKGESSIFGLFDTFERVVFLSSDVIVRHDCPNLFDRVPNEMLGMLDEGSLYSHDFRFSGDMERTFPVFMVREGKESYDVGVIVASRCHRDLFDIGTDFEAALNARISSAGTPVYDIGCHFNRAPCTYRAMKKSRLHSYIVRYNGFQDPLAEAKRDAAVWESIRKTPQALENDSLYDLSAVKAWDFPRAMAPGWIARDIIRKDEYDIARIDFRQGDVVLDIGANVGIVSVLIAKNNPKTVVFAIEPCNVNFDHLVMNIKQNGVANILPFNLALTEDGRRVSIGVDEVNSGGGTIYGFNGPVDHRNSCRSTTLDDFIRDQKIGHIRFLKCDTEGAEYEIFYGFKGWSAVDYLSVEVHPPKVEGRWSREDFVSFLRSKMPPDRLKIVLI